MKTSRSHEWVMSNQNRAVRPQEWEAPNQMRSSRSHEWDHSCGGKMTAAPPGIDPNNPEQVKMANTFGLIKDISVNNILANDTDKTKDFDKKDFSQMYVKKHPAAMHEMETVFEPRPPYPSNRDEVGGRRLHLTPPPATTCYQSGCQDVWIEQSQLKQNDLYNTGAYCRSPNSRSPRQSIAVPRSPRENHARCPRESNSRSPRESFSRSPREAYNHSPRESICRSPRDSQPRIPWDTSRSPRGGDSASRSPREFYSRSPRDLPRPQPVFTFEPYATAGSVPDLLTSCPARCLAANNSHMVLPARDRAVHSCSDVAYDTVNPYEDDDPGPRLDAVLRSLQKLSTRLGENDEFLSSLSSDLNQDPPQQSTSHHRHHHGSSSSSSNRCHGHSSQGHQGGPNALSHDQETNAPSASHGNDPSAGEGAPRHIVTNLSQPSTLPSSGEGEEEDENAVFV